MAQLRFGQLVRRIEQDGAIAAETQLRIQLAKRLDQIGLAMEIDRVLTGLRLHLIDADGAAALALRREIARLPPFQRFFQRADTAGGLGRVEDQPAQRQQFCLHGLWIGAEDGVQRGILVACAFLRGVGRNGFLECLFHRGLSAHAFEVTDRIGQAPARRKPGVA